MGAFVWPTAKRQTERRAAAPFAHEPIGPVAPNLPDRTWDVVRFEIPLTPDRPPLAVHDQSPARVVPGAHFAHLVQSVFIQPPSVTRFPDEPHHSHVFFDFCSASSTILMIDDGPTQPT